MWIFPSLSCLFIFLCSFLCWIAFPGHFFFLSALCMLYVWTLFMSWIFQIFFLVTFRSLIHLEFLIILCKILLSYCMLVSTAPFSWWIKWLFLSQNTFLNICDLIFIFSSLSHWSIYVFLEQHYTYTSYTYNLLFLASLQLGRALWLIQASLVAQWVRNPPAMCNLGSIPGWGRSPGEANGNPLQYSCLENPMGGGAW